MVQRTVKENERGYRLKPRPFRGSSRPIRVLSDVPVFSKYTVSRLYHVTIILHCPWFEFWSRDTDVLIILSIIPIRNEIIKFK